jgi:hypothetical protein
MAMKTGVLFLLSVGLAAVAAAGQEAGRQGQPGGPSERARVVKFLKDHVIGKTLVTPESVFKYDSDKVEGVYSGMDSFTNLVETRDGFKFDVLTVSKLTNYDLDKKGKRVLPGRDEGGIYMVRYELSERRSTGKLVGTSRVVSSTHRDFTAGYTAAVLMGLRDGVLESRESSILYEDFFAAGGKLRPGASEAVVRFSSVGGKLRQQGEQLQYDVDVRTLKRTRTADPPMRWVSKQAD